MDLFRTGHTVLSEQTSFSFFFFFDVIYADQFHFRCSEDIVLTDMKQAVSLMSGSCTPLCYSIRETLRSVLLWQVI